MNEIKDSFKMIHEGISRIEKILTEDKTPKRFIDNGDNTITDTKTGLVWIKDHDQIDSKFSQRRTWDEAIEVCKKLDYAGHHDWRLPTREELLTIVDLTKHNPAADPIFKVHTDDWYWTSTPCAWDSGYAWCVHFGYGYVGYGNLDSSNYVRPVRSSQ